MAIVEVLKYNGKSNVFAWKYPNEELGTWTQLIVNESQEAVFVKEGKILDILGAGRHTLSTENIPLLSKLINLPFGGKSPFTAEVWYINKAYSLDVKWGTATPIQLQDPKYQVFIPVRAFGQFGIRISDSTKFLKNLVGVLKIFESDDIIEYFRGLFMTKVKDVVSNYLIRKKISILEINAYLDEISQCLKESILEEMNKYGIDLVNFYVISIDTPEDDDAVIRLKEALAKKAEMNIVGYDYRQERSFDTLDGVTQNSDSTTNNLMGAGIGLAMGMGLGGNIGNQFGNMASNINVQEKNGEKKVKCSNCNYEYSKDVKFCPNCGNIYNACPSCGADIEDGETICKECGNRLPIRCPKCNARTLPNQKFCTSCGASLIKRCTECQEEISENSKFCPSCGKKI